MQDTQQMTPRILATTDFTPEGESAFFHALAFAVRQRARLTLLHTGSESRHAVPWERFPSVRETLAAWQMLPSEAPRSAVADELGVGVAKMAMRDDDPRQGITDYLRKHPTDLLVIASEGRRGLARLLNPSVADSVSNVTNSNTLMLPKHGRGFVDAQTGKASLSRVLCAFDANWDPRPGLAYLKEWLPVFSGGAPVDVTLLQTGDGSAADNVLLPRAKGQNWHRESRSGDPVTAIIDAARDANAELVIINARGPKGLRARLRGSRTDKILRALKCPLLSIPAL